MQHNPEFRSVDGHLLYARTLDACGEDDKALEEYEAIAAYYAGAEARLRFGNFLEKRGKRARALAQYREIVSGAELAPRHYRQAQRRWIQEARHGISRLGS